MSATFPPDPPSFGPDLGIDTDSVRIDQQVLDRLRVRFHMRHDLTYDSRGRIATIQLDWREFLTMMEPWLT